MNGSIMGGVTPAHIKESGAMQAQKNPVNQANDRPKTLGINKTMPPLGLEPRTHGLRVRCSTN